MCLEVAPPEPSELQLDGKGGDVLVLAPSNGPLPHDSLVNTESSKEEIPLFLPSVVD